MEDTVVEITEADQKKNEKNKDSLKRPVGQGAY